MHGVQPAVLRHRPRGGDQPLSQHLATEHPLQSGLGLPTAEEPDLDLLEVQQLDGARSLIGA